MNETWISFAGWVGSPVVMGEGGKVSRCSFRVASTPRRFRNGSWGDGETIWYTVKAWRNLAENVNASLKVGQAVIVQGTLGAENWEQPDGTVIVRTVVTATAVGHDLNRGTATFFKKVSQTGEDAKSDEAAQRMMEQAERSTVPLDSNGDPVSAEETAAETSEPSSFPVPSRESAA